MRTLWNYSNYGNDIQLTRRDAEACNHSGPCDNDIEALLLKPYIKKQIAKLTPDVLAKELREYGAWDGTELSDHNQNIIRWLWISAGDICERS